MQAYLTLVGRYSVHKRTSTNMIPLLGQDRSAGKMKKKKKFHQRQLGKILRYNFRKN